MPQKSLSQLIIFIFCINLICLSNKALSQDKNIVSGIVISQETSQPIEAVSITINNRGIGSVTNADGKFIIALTPETSLQDSLAITCIGYKPQKVSIGYAKSNLNLTVKLESAIENLQEVTVKPLSLKELLDSIKQHNLAQFVSPMKLAGYYRELVFTNSKVPNMQMPCVHTFLIRKQPMKDSLRSMHQGAGQIKRV
jgi:hypothetical protein